MMDTVKEDLRKELASKNDKENLEGKCELI